MKFDRKMLQLYAVTDRNWVGKQTFYEQLEDALRGGVTLVQLREKNISDEEFVAEAKEMKELCHRYGVPLIINDNVEVALESGADGVHVGIEDMPVSEIRKIASRDFIIGATAKTVRQAQIAKEGGADYLGVGAVFPSPTKKNAVRITRDQLDKISESVSMPIVAIGGITSENLSYLAGAKIDGIAVVSAIFSAENILESTAMLKERTLEYLK